MDAQMYDMAAIRSKRDTAITMEKLFHTSTVLGGLELMIHAQSSLAKYAHAMLSFHQAIWFPDLSLASKPATKSDVMSY
jgi:hypothetical protein